MTAESKGPANKIFGDGVIPKNKSIVSFHTDIQEESEREKLLARRRMISTPSSDGFKYGKSFNENHNMDDIMRNQYNKQYVNKRKYDRYKKQKWD